MTKFSRISNYNVSALYRLNSFKKFRITNQINKSSVKFTNLKREKLWNPTDATCNVFNLGKTTENCQPLSSLRRNSIRFRNYQFLSHLFPCSTPYLHLSPNYVAFYYTPSILPLQCQSQSQCDIVLSFSVLIFLLNLKEGKNILYIDVLNFVVPQMVPGIQ